MRTIAQRVSNSRRNRRRHGRCGAKGAAGTAWCSPRRSPWSWNLRWNCLPSRNRSKDFHWTRADSRCSCRALSDAVCERGKAFDLVECIAEPWCTESVRFNRVRLDECRRWLRPCSVLECASESIEDSKNIRIARTLVYCSETGALRSNASDDTIVPARFEESLETRCPEEATDDLLRYEFESIL